MRQSKTPLSIIVACSRNGVIGDNGRMPWHLPDDFAYFKQMTKNKPVIMGRKTWESLPVRPLVGRKNLILTKNYGYKASGAFVYTNLDVCLAAASAMAEESGASEIMVMGGAQVYAEVLPFADKIYLTKVDADLEGDTYFPKIHQSEWQSKTTHFHSADERHIYSFNISELDRIQSTKWSPIYTQVA